MDPDSDPDPDPAIFAIDLQGASKKLIFNTIFSACYFLKVHLHYFSKIKSQASQNSRIQDFSYYFCMMIEGSGSGRPKNTWILFRIRIQNTTCVAGPPLNDVSTAVQEAGVDESKVQEVVHEAGLHK
jgi:hypothetical protein